MPLLSPISNKYKGLCNNVKEVDKVYHFSQKKLKD